MTSQAETGVLDHNDGMLHAIVYLQVAIISQALIFVTRSHGFCFMERPSIVLMFAFVVAQVVSSIISAYAVWGFTNIKSISGGWIGIVWVWVSLSSVTYAFVLVLIIVSLRISAGSCPWISSSSP